MKADTVDLAAIFGQQVSYRIPMFQRPYVWKEDTEWAPLWDDIQAVLERQLDDIPANDDTPHFLGAVVFDQVLNQAGKVQSRHVIDGQQRLTTLQLFIAAARTIALELNLTDAARMFSMLLYNEEFLVRDRPDDRVKVLPSVFDRDAFVAVIGDDASAIAAAKGHRISDAYEFFRERILEWAVADRPPEDAERRIEILSTVLWKLLVVVAIDLDARDNAQVIFETLNARGTPLLAADLIKNHLFQAATTDGSDTDALYAKYWQSLDRKWWREEVQIGRLNRPRLDIFMNHWLSMRLGREVVAHQLFREFKRFVAAKDQSVEAILDELAIYAAVYEGFEKEAHLRTPFGMFLYRLNTMEVTTAYPFLLWLFGPEGIADESERLLAAKATESWLVRRVLRRANTQGYSALFLALLANLRKLRNPHSRDVAAYLRSLEGERGYWPTDEEIHSSLQSSPLYTLLLRRRLRMVLEAIEDELQSKAGAEASGVNRDLTVEHVLPQTWRTHWPLPETDDEAAAAANRDVVKHTIGNLLLITGRLNAEQSNYGWAKKKKLLNVRSTLLMSAEVRTEESWDESIIHLRSERLAAVITALWPGPESPKWT